MGNMTECLQCGQLIGMWDKKCRYCGTRQFGEHDEYYPKPIAPPRKKKERLHFSDEEKLALGLYPKDEGYKMSLISRILGRK